MKNTIQNRASLTSGDYLSVAKPAQYTGGEVNSVTKDDADIAVHFALCFPDTYEVGMSHLGIQILYEILNGIPDVWAERTYMPLADMEAILREKKLPICSLESHRPLRNFDILGISLQYELCTTNILTMLDLSGIPLLGSDRGDTDPIVLGGGPWSYHPEPVAPYFDAFFLGDAEEAILEVIDLLREAKLQGKPRSAVIQRLADLEGIYVPSQFVPEYDSELRLQAIRPQDGQRSPVVRRLLPTMEGAPFPVKPVVPNVKTVHNRLNVEVMRGCVRGCRFCQAGYLYRPQRERKPEEILRLVESSLATTGYEELSLLSLSTADYCSVVPLLRALMDRYGDGDKLAISFPSTRVDALTPEVLEQVQRVRRTGFTVAPEGGTQRLRDVINKGVSDEQILATCQNVFGMGWSGIKLYFMLGLPSETDEDLQGIINIARRIKGLPDARGKDITVSVSTFVPKPHTPFQWSAQIDPTETLRRQRFLAVGLKKIGVTFRYHDAFSSFLEGVLCRGGRELAPVIQRAYELGCRLDAWQDQLSEENWMQAFSDCGVHPGNYLRERSLEEVLPWDHLSCGIDKSYFIKEYQRALRARETPDCLTKSCSICGACDYDSKRNILWPREMFSEISMRPSPSADTENSTEHRFRLNYSKGRQFAFLGHLEFATVIMRAARRAALPLSYTAGFHPLPKISFGPPLQLGIESEDEYLDMVLLREQPTNETLDILQKALPPGICIRRIEAINLNTPSIQELLTAQTFELRWLVPPQAEIGQLLQQSTSIGSNDNNAECDWSLILDKEIIRHQTQGNRHGKKGGKAQLFRLANHLGELTWIRDAEEISGLRFRLLFETKVASPRPLEIASAITNLGLGELLLTKTQTQLRASEFGTFIARTVDQENNGSRVLENYAE